MQKEMCCLNTGIGGDIGNAFKGMYPDPIIRQNRIFAVRVSSVFGHQDI